jgi:hypothetical protein
MRLIAGLASVLPPVLWLLCATSQAGAETAPEKVLQAPVGGKAISLGERVACGVATGWTVEREGRAVRPPTTDEAVGQAAPLTVAPAQTGCGKGETPVTLVTTGKWPQVDPASLVIHLDEARAELRGKRMKGVRLVVEGGGVRSDDICNEPKADPSGVEVCTFAISKKLPANPGKLAAWWSPAGSSGDQAAVTFDVEGRRVAHEQLALRPAKVAILSLTAPGTSVDVSRGTARYPLLHGEAVTSVDCAPAFCEIDGGALLVRGVTQTAATLRVRARLLPRVVFAKGDVADATPVFEVPILRCPMAIVSGVPFARLDDARTVVKLEGRCAEDVRSLRFFADSNSADVFRIETAKDAAFVVLKLGRVEDELSIRAVKNDTEGTTVGLLKTSTRRLPPTLATLELESGVPIDFIPTNRSAIVHVVPPDEDVRVIVLPIEGVYTVTDEDGTQRVRAVAPVGSLTSLRYAIRSRASGVPKDLANENIGIASDPVQRPIKSANIPAPLANIVELRCVDRNGVVRNMVPGQATQLPFHERDGCSVVMNRNRLRPEDGIQKLTLDIAVTKPDGTPRPEAHVNESTVLRPGPGSRVAWIQGVNQPFDHVTVRVSHVQDDQLYAAKSEEPLSPAARQWSLTMGTAIARLYLTAAIPTVLYRVSKKDSSGILSLNFGVIGRLTWVDSDGFDGILAIEGGVTGVGLAPIDTGSNNTSVPQVAAVVGLGLGVPLVNRAAITQTSINLHGWFEYEVSRGSAGSPYGFLFGPSISFGNIGTYL